jgi:hypothetical protein
MIDEPKETKKEKRDAARQARIEQQRRRQRARRRKKMVVGGLSAVLVVVLVAFAVVQVSQGKSRSQAAVKAAATAAGCDGGIIQYPDAGRQHIDNVAADKRRPYTSTPPTSGDHYGVLPPPPNFYTEPTLRPETYVHALEHGQIFIHYNDIPQAQVDQLEKIQSEHPASTTVMKDPEIKAPVAITAWRHMEQCKSVSKPVIENFIEQRCNKGPENFNIEC